MAPPPVRNIAVFGNGLAGLFCVTKLAQILPDSIELTYIEAAEPGKTEALWGHVTSPAAYDFLLTLGITEPDILPYTNTSFSLGTRYENWGPDNRSWTQSFYRPLPAYNGVSFHHYLTRLSNSSAEFSDIQPYIMSVQAGKSGVFAHPPEGKKIPLADVEYGYHFEPSEWCQILSETAKSASIDWIKADILDAVRDGETVQSVSLSNGQIIEADFIIDALGAQSKLAHQNGQITPTGGHRKAFSSFIPSEMIKGVCRILTGKTYGWRSETPLQNGVRVLTVFDPEFETEAEKDHAHTGSQAIDQAIEMTCGRLTAPWTGNCLTLGHGAALVEPLTTTPVLLLQRDIERLAELIPVTKHMGIESREYNRRFNDDYAHAEMFQRAFFEPDANAKSPIHTKLREKIEQFKSRGVLVQYDYEPFGEEDWIALHLGMGRHPARYDPLADHIPEEQLKHRLSQMRTAIEQMAKKMPPHHVYMAGLLKYLKEKHG